MKNAKQIICELVEVCQGVESNDKNTFLFRNILYLLTYLSDKNALTILDV